MSETDFHPSEEQIEAQRAVLLSYYTHPERLSEWASLFPKLSVLHIKRAVHEVIEELKKTTELEKDFDGHIHGVLISFQKQIEVQVDRFLYPTPQQLADWQQEFPYLCLEEIQEHFHNEGLALQSSSGIMVSLTFPKSAETSLKRKTEETRSQYKQNVVSAKNEAEAQRTAASLIEVENEKLFLFSIFCTHFFSKSIKTIPVIALMGLCSTISAVTLETNPKSFEGQIPLTILFSLMVVYPVPLTLSVLGKSAKEEVLKVKERIRPREMVDPTSDLSSSAVPKVLDQDSV